MSILGGIGIIDVVNDVVDGVIGSDESKNTTLPIVDGLLGNDDGTGSGTLVIGDIVDLDALLGGTIDDGPITDASLVGDVLELDALLGIIDPLLADIISTEGITDGAGLLNAVDTELVNQLGLDQLLGDLDVLGIGTESLVDDLLAMTETTGLVRDTLEPLLGDPNDGLVEDVLDLLLGQDDATDPDDPGNPINPDNPDDPNDPGDDDEPGPDPDGPTGPTDRNAYDRVEMGTENRDTFTLGDNEAVFVAGAGDIDTAVYAQSSDEFSYALASNGIFLTDADDTDYLQSVERVEFTDGYLALDIGFQENAGFAYRLYAAALGREPDNDGLDYWIGEVDSGLSREIIALGFVNSQEFRENFGANLTDQEFVETTYINILGRNTNQADQDFWLGELEAGFSRGVVLAGISESAENLENTREEIGDFIFIT